MTGCEAEKIDILRYAGFMSTIKIEGPTQKNLLDFIIGFYKHSERCNSCYDDYEFLKGELRSGGAFSDFYENADLDFDLLSRNEKILENISRNN
ncbi:MAG: hypothetical protein AABX93_01865 [Nanoarchaeota archaeon]